jgi:hypothetical protein
MSEKSIQVYQSRFQPDEMCGAQGAGVFVCTVYPYRSDMWSTARQGSPGKGVVRRASIILYAHTPTARGATPVAIAIDARDGRRRHSTARYASAMSAITQASAQVAKTVAVSTGKVTNAKSMMVWKPHGNKYVFDARRDARERASEGCGIIRRGR